MQRIRLYVVAVVIGFVLGGCASVPSQKPPEMSNFSEPKPGTAGVYFYRWRSGPIGIAGDADFLLDGKLLASVHTGEYAYFEVPAGKHKYQFIQGMAAIDEKELDFLAGQNYFFRGTYSLTFKMSMLVTDTSELDQATRYIQDGSYKKVDAGSRPSPINRLLK